MAIILNMTQYRRVDALSDFQVGEDVDFFYPIVGDKGYRVVGTVTNIFVNREHAEDTYIRVKMNGIEGDYPISEIVLPEDLELGVKVMCGAGAVLPKYATPGSSGFDFIALEHVVLNRFIPTVVGTGLYFEIPTGYELQVRGRSGLALKGITISNGVGTVDSDYRGEVGIILTNISQTPYMIEAGDKIAQGIIAPIARPELTQSDSLSATVRGVGGYGSTGR